MSDQILRIDGAEFMMDDLSPEVRLLVGYYNKWNAELSEAKLEVAKIESAVRECIRELKGEVASLRARGELKSVAERQAEFDAAIAQQQEALAQQEEIQSAQYED